jgi:hypothetical protein
LIRAPKPKQNKKKKKKKKKRYPCVGALKNSNSLNMWMVFVFSHVDSVWTISIFEEQFV